MGSEAMSALKNNRCALRGGLIERSWRAHALPERRDGG